MVSIVNLKLFKTICMWVISLMDSWVNFLCPHRASFYLLNKWEFLLHEFWQENLFWLGTRIVALGKVMFKCWELDKQIFWWYFVWFFVPFCMHFHGRTHIWTLVLYCTSTTTQLSERVGNCTNLWRFEDSTLDNGRGN